MKEVIKNLLGFMYSFSMGDYLFFIGTFLLIVLFIYVLYLIKLSDEEEKEENVSVTTDDFDLEAVTKAIEKDYKPETIRLTPYEVEQEQNAIISYDELVNKKNTVGIDYDDEYASEIPEISIKKINLTSDLTKIEEEPKLAVKLMQYDKEEAFLKALKELQEKLSH
jgi:Ca2+/Na+ antiporter